MTRLAILRHNARQTLIAFDQGLNALAGLCVALACLCPRCRKAGLWWADETISAHCWRWHLAGTRSWPARLVDGLARLVGDTNHCRESYESERQGRQLPPELRPPQCRAAIRKPY